MLRIPGRKMASSIWSGRLVHPITTTPCRPSTPSISFNSVLSTLSFTPPLLSPESQPTGAISIRSCRSQVNFCLPLRVPIASISSRNTMHGAIRLAVANRLRILRSVSPRYFEKISGLVIRVRSYTIFWCVFEALNLPLDRYNVHDGFWSQCLHHCCLATAWNRMKFNVMSKCEIIICPIN